MSWLPWIVGGAGLGGASLALASAALCRQKGLHRWLPEYVRTRQLRRTPSPDEPLSVYIAVCDHYEPFRGGSSLAQARSRVQEWQDKYPAFLQYQDSAGRPPQHTFFTPEDEYHPEIVEQIAEMCRDGFGEVEVHLHHDNDTAELLREKLLRFKEVLHEKHGLLATDKQTGEVVYGFIHGNWCLDNSRSDGRYCGVNNEIDILRETGCYADFTMPSAPSETQTRQINSIYWAVDDPNRPKSHNTGPRVGTGPRPEKSLLMIQGPLVLDWRNAKWGLIPRIENGNLQKSQPPSRSRLDHWLRAAVNLPGMNNQVAVKLHTDRKSVV